LFLAFLLPRPFLVIALEGEAADFIASCLTNSENLFAPVAMDASARLVVFAATVPNAAASFSPEANAARARSSAALIDSLEGEVSRLP
jgi:hypothetical protein